MKAYATRSPAAERSAHAARPSGSKEASEPFFSGVGEKGPPPFFPVLQAKLDIDAQDSPLEKEAEATAETVVSAMDASTFFAPATEPLLPTTSDPEPAADPETLQTEVEETSPEEEEETDAPDSVEEPVEDFSPAEPEPEPAPEAPAEPMVSPLPTIQTAPEPPIQRAEERSEDQESEEEVEEVKPAKQLVGAADSPRSDAPPGAEAATFIHRKETAQQPAATGKLEQELRSRRGGGQPLPPATRQGMGQAFGADFSSVRIHTDPGAVEMNRRLGAQAFTFGADIYFNAGKYDPGSSAGQHLLAHELTHTLQQGGTVRRSAYALTPSPLMVQGFGIIDLIPDWIIEGARNIPGYTLFTFIIEYDPLREQTVERTPIRLIEGLMGLVPFGTAIFDKLQEHGIIDRAYGWISGQLDALGLSTSALLDLLEEAWDELEFPYDNAIAVITAKFRRLLSRIIRFAESLVSQLMDWIREALVGVAEPLLAENQAWALIKKILHHDPLRDEPVEATTVEILEDFLRLIGRETELEQMRERGTLQETADWLDTQLGTFLDLLATLGGLIDAVWEAIQPENLPNILESLESLATRVTDFLLRVWDFATTVATQVLELIKQALLSWLNSFAADIPGFTLLTVILGRNPLTDEPVARSVQNIIRGFMGLVPGGEAKYQELSETGVIPRAAAQIEALVAELGISWAFIRGLFTDLWASFSIDDLVDPVGAFQRVVDQFGEPIARLFTFVSRVVRILVELILEIMGIPPDLIGGIINNMMSAIEDIKRDPVQFLLNLLNALKEGFLQFFNNIGTHLLQGLQNWLFGTLADAGVQIPPDLSLRSILGMAMELLGITVDNILDRLALRIGEERVAQIRAVLDTLSGIWAFVRDVIERGPIAIVEYVQDQLSNLWDIIRDGIMGFIQERVIQQAITWLLSFLDVTGIMPVIRGVQTVFNAVSSFIEKLREILEIVASFVAGVADIARGNIRSAADFLERALADGIPVAIAFLARQLGLGRISERIHEMIEAARGRINEAIDWLIDQALRAGTAFLRVLGLGGREEEEGQEEEANPQDSNEAVDIKNRAAQELGNRISQEKSIPEIQSIIAQVLQMLSSEGLRSLELVGPDEEGRYEIVSSASEPSVAMRLAPENAYVSMSASIEMRSGSPTEGLTRTTGFYEPPESMREITEGRRIAEITPVSYEGRTRGRRERARSERQSGGLIIEPGEGENVLEFVSWSTGRAMRDNNISHAERQFEHWFRLQARENAGWLRRIRRISITISLSPCQLCTADLISVANLAKIGNPEVDLQLTYQDIHSGSNPTRQSDIERLRANDWSVSGPAVEAGNSTTTVEPSPPIIRRRSGGSS